MAYFSTHSRGAFRTALLIVSALVSFLTSAFSNQDWIPAIFVEETAAKETRADTAAKETGGEAVEKTKGTGEAIRVVTWNIEWFPGRSPRANAKDEATHRVDVAHYLPGLEADILLLQEIRSAQEAAFLIDRLPGLEMHVASNFVRPNPRISQQIVIASRYPARAGFMELFRGEGFDQEDGSEAYRGFSFAALETPLGGTTLVYAVHFKSNRGNASVNIPMRESAARQVLEHVEAMARRFKSDGPIQVIVGGDFNMILDRDSAPSEQTLAIFEKGGFHSTWEGVPFEDRVTWPSRGRYGDACFDYIITRDLPHLTAEILYKPETELSDHRPVLVSIPVPARK